MSQKELFKNYKGGGRMLYPYSFSALVDRFPFKYLWNNSRVIRMGSLSFVITMFVFHKIGKLTRSDASQKVFAEFVKEEYKHRNFIPIDELNEMEKS
ncbi:hypothetical protein A3Q56_02176 [Intoshia linei]|uniref:Uncharacterized protein n=1 Tax=Intoshia linei TaxID=1819745 RepID=A0A177B6Z7_9BILA|nr:hypothetical protein A3Q56_02176 [Intoshia linei]